MARDLNRIYGDMINEMCNMMTDGQMLDSCMSMREEAIRYVPLRYRIIALGFVKRYSLDELNLKLEQQGCPRLYSRNFWEATLIFAFLHGCSYADWKEIQSECADIYARVSDSEWFSGRTITYGELERYVQGNSESRDELLATEMRTGYLERELRGLGGSVAELREFLWTNVHSFSGVREKTRYYFCKYLYYYLNRRIENYFDACRRGRGIDEALSDLLSLKVVTNLRRNQRMPEPEKRAKIRESAISCGEIFDEFNYFYFGYVSIDWAEILMECYESVSDIPAAQKKNLAEVFRKNRPEWKKCTDEEVIARRIRETELEEDTAYGLEGNRGYGKNRAGEHALHKFIQGTLDIDRMVLICFLLFFASDAQMPTAHRITRERLQEILLRCGYPRLDMENDFDWFVEEFLESRHPMDFLMEVMIGYAKQNENSFLYHIYSNSTHYEDELIRVMIPSESQYHKI